MRSFDDHPCFNHGAHRRYARVHLPVAPACNIQCRFCNRKYDCVNESRPGVTSAVLSPVQALAYLREQCDRRDDIRVVGIAGPGDALADAERTLDTLRRIREAFPDMLLCVATNGLALPRHVEELIAVGVSHVTVTINAVSPVIGARIYEWMLIDGQCMHGEEAAAHLLEAQEQAIRRLAETDMLVKVNTIIIPGVNDHHVETIARTIRDWGVDRMNCMPLKPTADTSFADVPEPPAEAITALRERVAGFVPQMTHCTRCRSDACGKLGEDNPAAQASLMARAADVPAVDPRRSCAAVASRDGYFVNMHLGEARELLIYRPTEQTFDLVDVRRLPPRGGGEGRWQATAALLRDCRALVVSGVGGAPRAHLKQEGLQIIEAEGLIADVLDPVFAGEELPPSLTRCFAGCGAACGGTGGGCG